MTRIWRAAAVGLCLVGVVSVTADAQTRALTLEDYFRLDSVSATAISPDGAHVAFVHTRIDEVADRRVNEVWVATADGSKPPRRLSPSDVTASSPRWSADGALVVFTARKLDPGGQANGGSPIWFVRTDQPDAKPYQIEGVDTLPWFSPDGRWMAFTRKVTAAGAAPASTSPAPGSFDARLRDRFKGRIYEWLEYRFDGRGYLPNQTDPKATPAAELHVAPLSGSPPRQLTTLGVDVREVAWRPDSQALVITADAFQRDEQVYERADVWVVDLQGVSRRLTDDGFDHDQPAWAPDGQSIVVRRNKGLSLVIKEKAKAGAPTDLVRIAATGGDLRGLTDTWDLIPETPVWSKDGRFVYFAAETAGNDHLFRVPASGGPVEQITRGDRQLGSISVDAATARMAYTAATVVRPADVFVAAIDGSAERKLSTFNDTLLAELALRPAERVTFPSKDGTEIEGWVMLPPGYDRSRQYPLILAIHGGPHGAYGNAFAFQHQYLATNGYVLLYTNPRGSTGYGEKFLWATWGGWGVLDYQDVMAGVDHVLGKYAVDQRRLGVAGYSYGGFLTNWVITQTKRFRAAAVGAGISNWISDYGTADIPRTKESEFFGSPWEAGSAELMWQLSPIKHAGNVATPTLFVHGEADLRVPIEQGEQMYTALKKRQVPSRFIRYPDMYHGGWTPWNTAHRYHQELQWWREQLGGQTPVPSASGERR